MAESWPKIRRYSRDFPLTSSIPDARGCSFSLRAAHALVAISEWYDTFRRAASRSKVTFGVRLPVALYYHWYGQWASRLFTGAGEQFRSRADLVNLATVIEKLESVASGYFGRALDIAPDDCALYTTQRWTHGYPGHVPHIYDDLLGIEEGDNLCDGCSRPLSIRDFLQYYARFLLDSDILHPPTIDQRELLAGLRYFDGDGASGRGGPVYARVVESDFSEEPPRFVRGPRRLPYRFPERKRWLLSDLTAPAWRLQVLDFCRVAVRQFAIRFGAPTIPLALPATATFPDLPDLLLDRANLIPVSGTPARPSTAKAVASTGTDPEPAPLVVVGGVALNACVTKTPVERSGPTGGSLAGSTGEDANPCPVRFVEEGSVSVLTAAGKWDCLPISGPVAVAVLRALATCYPDGRTYQQLRDDVASPDPVRRLNAACEAHPALKAVVSTPKVAHRGTGSGTGPGVKSEGLYRLVPPTTANA